MTTLTISLRSTVRQAREQISCDLGGEAVILNVRSGEYYGLNAVGRRVWALLEGGRTVAEVRDGLLAEFDVDAERCTADLLRVLSDLAEAELIQVATEADVVAR